MSDSTTTWLRAEGFAVFLGAVGAYIALDASWLLFALLLLAPDLSMLGYLAGPRTGAGAYNLVHLYLWPAGLLVLGISGAPWALPPAAIWAAHIGLDRALGFGLKRPGGFRDTHLGRLRGPADAGSPAEPA
ncbi:MAG: DUF4260 family protein [Gemmatimonadetes bacterium]|nr:DUF4260 domain-containing protein [Gemmatimonadota bacterium]NIQ57149.1 DUF4260 domain-containing protein [Gemmatimonadota bacterium]NIU77324.1 DUF4260 family protein [Gammaproteobacteria bacterium]NIX46585.1 DUF4260 family protein [Gemmatimonadota bacterium]NIY10909.1 DUF4260 family protein [Gemmatimonadota bacterium]